MLQLSCFSPPPPVWRLDLVLGQLLTSRSRAASGTGQYLALTWDGQHLVGVEEESTGLEVRYPGVTVPASTPVILDVCPLLSEVQYLHL